MTFYHGTSEENWKKIQEEGILYGRRYILDNDTREPIEEVDRCTYLAVDVEEAKHYGDVVLEVEYNPFNSRGNIKRSKKKLPVNNYVEGCWQLRVYEPILLENIKRIR